MGLVVRREPFLDRLTGHKPAQRRNIEEDWKLAKKTAARPDGFGRAAAYFYRIEFRALRLPRPSTAEQAGNRAQRTQRERTWLGYTFDQNIVDQSHVERDTIWVGGDC